MKYSLSSTLEKVDQPVFGFSTTVTTQVKYALTEKTSGKEVCQGSASGRCTAKMSGSFYGPKRLQIGHFVAGACPTLPRHIPRC